LEALLLFMSISEREQVNRFGLLEQDGLVTGFVLCVDHEPGQVRRKLERSSVFGLPAEVRTKGKPAAERLQFIYLLKDPVWPKDDRPMLLRHVAADLTGLAFVEWSSPTLSGNEIVETNDTVIDLEEDALAVYLDGAKLRQYEEWRDAQTGVRENVERDDDLYSDGFVKLPIKILRNPNLGIYDKLTWAGYKAYDWQKGYCVPSQQTVAKDIGICERKVRDAEKKLWSAGLMTKTRRGGRKTDRHHFPDQTAQSTKPKSPRKRKS
jgi:hypothetical protein